MIYLNEFDPFAAEWLNRLSFFGEIPLAFVDSRSIKDVTADYVRDFTQCHFFAGIGGWPLAFALAGIPDWLNAWFGSCPCQPFSTAGKGEGTEDDRHLWPVWFPLIDACRPEYVFGEQVSAAIGHGWLDGVFADMERAGYTGGATVLGAHSVRSPHIRQRVFWGFKRISDSSGSRYSGTGQRAAVDEIGTTALPQWGFAQLELAGSGGASVGLHHAGHRSTCLQEPGSQLSDDRLRLLDANSDRRTPGGASASIDGYGSAADSAGCGLRDSSSNDEQRSRQFVSIGECELETGGSGSGIQHTKSDGRNARGTESGGRGITSGCGGLLLPSESGLQGHSGHGDIWSQSGRFASLTNGSTPASDPWSGYTIGHYRDGKARRIGRGVFPLAYGIPRTMGQPKSRARLMARNASSNRKGRLKGYGNATVPILAATFIRAFMEVTSNDE